MPLNMPIKVLKYALKYALIKSEIGLAWILVCRYNIGFAWISVYRYNTEIGLAWILVQYIDIILKLGWLEFQYFDIQKITENNFSISVYRCSNIDIPNPESKEKAVFTPLYFAHLPSLHSLTLHRGCAICNEHLFHCSWRCLWLNLTLL